MTSNGGVLSKHNLRSKQTFNWKPHSVSLQDLLIEILRVDGEEEASA